MARYAIGDIQGCYTKLIQLINTLDFNPSKDHLYLVGDLVNRGPESLEVLNWAYENQDSISITLGNHDIYLLRRFYSTVKPDPDETINDILKSQHCKKLIEWLRKKPLIINDNQFLIAHAGIYPKLNLERQIEIGEMISWELKSYNPTKFLDEIFGNKPNYFKEELTDLQKMRFIINSSTRMRFLKIEDYSLDFKFKGDLNNKPDTLIPWFKVKFDSSITKKIVFGHWAALGFNHQTKFISLDTGCVWGRKLTAIDLDKFSVFQV